MGGGVCHWVNETLFICETSKGNMGKKEGGGGEYGRGGHFLPVLASGLFPLRNFHSICAKGGFCLRVALR